METTMNQEYSIEQRDEQLIGTDARIRYHCHFNRAGQHLVCIDMEIDTDEAVLTLVMPSWIPGSYKVRDFISHQGDLKVRDLQGRPVSYDWKEKNVLSIDNTHRSSTVRVSYTYYANERTVRTMHVNRWRAFVNPANCMMYVQGREHEVQHVYLYHGAASWSTVSSSLSPVPHLCSAGDVTVLGALNYDILVDSPIEVGNHVVETFDACGAKHEVAVVSSMPLDSRWIAEQCKVIVETEAAMFGGVPYDRYVFMIQVGSNIFGGLEHARSSVNMIDYSAFADKTTAGKLLALLCHEYFHTWNIKRIRPIEYGPFDYTKEVLSPMLWLAEGFTSYYDDLFSYRCGFMDESQYLKTLAEEHIGRLEEVPGRHAMNTRDASKLAWVKLYAQSPDGNNRHPSYYLKGGVITLLVDLEIIKRSNGSRRLDDAMREMWSMYSHEPSIGLREDEVMHAIRRSTGVDVESMMRELLYGMDDFDYVAAFESFGLKWEKHTVYEDFSRSTLSIGVSLKDEASRVVVTTVTDASPAQQAGLGIDDEIIAVNGLRIASASHFLDTVAMSNGDEFVVTASCDGRLFETTMNRRKKNRYALVMNNAATEEQHRLRAFWLSR